MSSTLSLPQNSRNARRTVWVLFAAIVLAILALPWNLEALSSWSEFRAATERLLVYLRAFATPDLSAPMLTRCLALAAETLAVALLGVAIGLVVAYPIALGASRCVVLGDDRLGDARLGGDRAPQLRLVRPVRFLQRAFMEGNRLLLDAMRGVPDFAWAIVLANITGVNAVTGVLAIAISVGGILGKVLSEQWDNVDPARYAALRSTGAGRFVVFLYGVQPLAARSMLSFVLMRTECAVRNASVIGVVGGGGLGAALWDKYTDGHWPGVATVLLTLLVVTATTDVLANWLRHRLRVDPNYPRAAAQLDRRTSARRRWQVLGAVLATLLASLYALREPLLRLADDLARIEWQFVQPYTLGLFAPDLHWETLASAARHSAVPLGIGVLATALAVLAGALLAYPASIAFQIEANRFTGERLPNAKRVWRWLLVVTARAIALVLRGVPEVAWVILLAVFFRIGVTPCLFAVALHSTGVLHRVFTESLDNIPYQRLERIGGACRPHVFLYGAMPRAWPDWRTYAFFQFEVNVRIGVALGMVGAGGLGQQFQINLAWREHADAATFLWAMILLTVGIDRLSRWLQLRRSRC